MRSLLSPGNTHLFIGSESHHQTTLALDTIFRALTDGYCIVGLCETEGEGAALQSRARLWLRTLQRSPAFNANVTFVTGHRHYIAGDALADAVLKQDEDFPIKGIIVFLDSASEMSAMRPEAHNIRLLNEARDFLPENAMTVLTAHTGPENRPAPPLTLYPADVVYQVISPGVSLAINVTPIKPQRSAPFTVQGIVHPGGTITLEEPERENV